MVKTCKGTVIMRKSIDENKVQRMRNLVTGDYTKTTYIRSGYTTKRAKRTEGDIWEERGKTWTIKNGIKQTINKLDNFRKESSMPLCCPKCSKKMKVLDKKAWTIFKFCSDCLVSFESGIQKAGKWEEYKKDVQDENFKSWIKEITQEFSDYMKQRESKTMISEAGDIEDWSGGQTKEYLEKTFETKIKEIREKRNESNKS